MILDIAVVTEAQAKLKCRILFVLKHQKTKHSIRFGSYFIQCIYRQSAVKAALQKQSKTKTKFPCYIITYAVNYSHIN